MGMIMSDIRIPSRVYNVLFWQSVWLASKHYILLVLLVVVNTIAMSRVTISFSAILVLVWNYFMSFHHFVTMFLMFKSLSFYPLLVFSFSYYIFFPFLGLLADVYIGRYRAILIGVILRFVSWIIIGLAFILSSYHGFLGTLWIVPGLILHYIGFISVVYVVT